MNLAYLRTFLDIVKMGSFSEVAKKLNISQPAVSFQIQKLEQDLGVQLIDRSQKTLAITNAGKYLIRFAEAVEKEHRILLQNIDRLREDVAGDLTIVTSTIPGDFILPPLLAEFKKLHPAVSIRVVVSDSARVIDAVTGGEYEIGFCGAAPREPKLETFKMAEDEIVLIVFPEHPFASKKRVSIVELLEEQLIFREQTSGTQESVSSLMIKAGYDFSQVKPSLVLGTTEAVVNAVEARSGIALVSNLAIKKSLALGLVKVVPIEGVSLKRDFWCIYRKQRVISRLLEEFIVFVKEGSQ
jgi:DNA-binding transcriptional LysR family regulator